MQNRKTLATTVAGCSLAAAFLGAAGIAGAEKPAGVDQGAVVIDRLSPGLATNEWAVLDRTGRPAGWLSPAEFGAAGASGSDPTLPIGSGAMPIKGFHVYDKSGNLVGYEVIALGFFTLAEAADAPRMDRLIAENEASEQKAYERFRPEFVERFGE